VNIVSRVKKINKVLCPENLFSRTVAAVNAQTTCVENELVKYISLFYSDLYLSRVMCMHTAFCCEISS